MEVKILQSRKEMGKTAAQFVASTIRSTLKTNGEVRMVFAAAPSQNEFLQELSEMEDIDWSKVTAFHMDEYLGLPDDAPQLFGNYLKKQIFDKVPFKEVNYLNPNPVKISSECRRYSELIKKAKIDITCMGIGENGHIAFNDPPEADFNDPETVKPVKLDLKCRQQQVNDGCFKKISDVPKEALTLTIPALISSSKLCIVVPGKLKADAVYKSLYGDITTECPGSILQNHSNAFLFLEPESASKLIKQ